jgi:glycosyltransferase involved in cell wall biosynthesis
MRIAIDYTSAIAQSAGIGRYTRALVEAMLREIAGERITLYSSEAPRPGSGFPDGATVRSRVAGIGPWAIGNRWMTILWHRLHVPLPIELFTGPVDVLHAPDFSLAPSLHARRVVTIHDLAYLIHPECALPGLIAYLNGVVSHAVHAADAVIAVSELTAEDLTARLGVPQEQITVIPLGVDGSFQPVRDATTRAALSQRYQLAYPLVLAVGTIEPRKNYARLIEAFARSTREYGGPRMLAFAGRDGWLYDSVYEAVAHWDVGDRVRFLGYVPEADLPALYSTADLLAMPSLYEGFGLPMVEAMACGTPVLCSDGGALPEVAGDAALIVPHGDVEAIASGLIRLSGDGALRAELVARGLERARQYTWMAAARAHLALYHQIAEAHSRGRVR